jgi:hypothetical protein
MEARRDNVGFNHEDTAKDADPVFRPTKKSGERATYDTLLFPTVIPADMPEVSDAVPNGILSLTRTASSLFVGRIRVYWEIEPETAVGALSKTGP